MALQLDDTDVVTAKMFYKNHKIGSDKYETFVDWGYSTVGDYVMLGSPYQLFSDNVLSGRGGVGPDIPVYIQKELVHPTSLDSRTAPLRGDPGNGPLHFKYEGV